jgi:hypothetical protein
MSVIGNLLRKNRVLLDTVQEIADTTNDDDTRSKAQSALKELEEDTTVPDMDGEGCSEAQEYQDTHGDGSYPESDESDR